MLKLVVYPALFGEPSASPFCVKAMGLLKLAGLSYSIEATDDPRKAPKAKLPVLQDTGAVIADSDQIRDHIEKTLGLDFDEGLDPAQRAVSRAVIRMMEEHLYFAIVCDRWINDDNWAHVKRTFSRAFPFRSRGSSRTTCASRRARNCTAKAWVVTTRTSVSKGCARTSRPS